jgi:DNA-binding transcriptional LysR family regulator
MNYIHRMTLSQSHLEAFLQIAQLGSFTKAADRLGLTQSALSHRIRNLEEDLEATVFLRVGTKIKLTEAGTRLLQYCQVVQQAEEEFVAEIKPKRRASAGLAGRLRVGGVSSIMRSLALPVLGELIRKNPEVRLDFLVKEAGELPALLGNAQVDFVLSTAPFQASGVEEELLGYEENVLVQSTRKNAIRDVYLDHDAEDPTTFEFLKLQATKHGTIARSFLEDIYGLIDAVTEGLGKAVVPVHMIADAKGVEVVAGLKPLLVPVYLYHFRQPYYTQLHQLAHTKLRADLSAKLRAKK